MLFVILLLLFCVSREGYLLPTWAQKIICRRFDWMFQSSSGQSRLERNVGKLFSELKLVTDNLLFIYAEANWEATERCCHCFVCVLNHIHGRWGLSTWSKHRGSLKDPGSQLCCVGMWVSYVCHMKLVITVCSTLTYVLFGCSFYYGDMERKYLPKVKPQNGVRMHMCRLTYCCYP